MDFYNLNSETVHQYKINLYEALNKYLFDNNLQKDNISSRVAKNGELIIEYNINNVKYNLNSTYNPTGEAANWIKQFNFKNINKIFVMFGIGNGIFCRKILEQLEGNEVLIIYEPSANIFFHTLNNFELRDILKDQRTYITVEGINHQDLIEVFDIYFNWTKIDSLIVSNHPQYDKIFTESYSDFLQFIKNRKIRAIIDRNTEGKFGPIMARNEVKNLKYFKDSCILEDFVYEIPKDIPAIIVAAGPSLDKNINDLKQAKNKSVIFAVDTALKYLLKNNIIPDFVVTLDANKSMSHFVDDRFKEIPLLCRYTSNPNVLDLHKGRKIFYYNDTFVGNMYELIGKEPLYNHVGGSVATAAFAICVGLQFNRIVLMGQDLCFQDGFTHAGKEIKNPYNSADDELIPIQDNYGNQVMTRYDWYTYILWYQDAIQGLRETGVEIDIINATEGGALIQGTRILSLQEVIDTYCTDIINVNDIIEKQNIGLNKDKLDIIREYLDKTLCDINDMDNYSAKAVDYCERLVIASQNKSINSSKNQEILRKISDYNKIMTEMPIYNLMNDFIAGTSTKQLDKIYQQSDNLIDNQVRVYTKSIEIYKAINNGTKALKPLLIEMKSTFN